MGPALLVTLLLGAMLLPGKLRLPILRPPPLVVPDQPEPMVCALSAGVRVPAAQSQEFLTTYI